MTLYELTGQWAELYDMLESGDEEVVQAAKDTMEGMEGEIDEKLENVGVIIKSLCAQVKALKKEQENIQKRRKTIENSADWLKHRALENLKVTGRKKGGGIRATISYSIRHDTSIDISDNAVIPEEFLVQQPPKIDRDGLKRAVKNGLVIDGVSLRDSESITVR